jgi:predicted Zn-dependent protease
MRKQKLKEALSDLNFALKLIPNDETFLSQRGKLNMKLGKCYDAVTDFDSLQR